MKRVLPDLAFIALLLMALCTIPALAQNLSVTDVHVSRPVAIPGAILKPGNYVFRLMDSAVVPGYVEITSKNGNRDYGFVPIYTTIRRSAFSGNEITLRPPDREGMVRIHSFFFPGMKDGYRFIYSKSDLRKDDMLAAKVDHNSSSAGM